MAPRLYARPPYADPAQLAAATALGATFDLGDASEVTFANLVDQQCDAAPNVTVAPDEFGELACVPTRSHTLRHNGFLTPPLEHPVLYKSE